jgi:AcrR family transcriptional regulator
VARLDRDTVIQAAIELADGGGLEALSLRRLAGELAVTPMALYRHVRDKDDLLDGIADRLYGELELPRPDEDWWEGLARLARSTRKLVLARPWSVPLFARPLMGPHARALDDALRGVLERAGFSKGEASELHDQLSNMVFALIAPELSGKPNRAAFERGLELLHAGLEARLRQRGS